MKIQELILYSSNLVETEKFYTEMLDLSLKQKTINKISFKIGESILSFKRSKSNHKYHFALNIPSNQIDNAKKWVSKKLKLIKMNNPEIIVSFDNWNAKSIYFYDNNRNIVELIAKFDLKNNSINEFSEESLLCINEIGVGTNDTKSIYNVIKKTINIPEYIKGPFREDFIAQGFENCLFVISKNNRNWYPTNDKVEIHPLEAIIKSQTEMFVLKIN